MHCNCPLDATVLAWFRLRLRCLLLASDAEDADKATASSELLESVAQWYIERASRFLVWMPVERLVPGDPAGAWQVLETTVFERLPAAVRVCQADHNPGLDEWLAGEALGLVLEPAAREPAARGLLSPAAWQRHQRSVRRLRARGVPP